MASDTPAPGLDPRMVGSLLDKIETHRNYAFKAYQRYTHRPGTITGNREYERYVKNDNLADEAVATLRAAILESTGGSDAR